MKNLIKVLTIFLSLTSITIYSGGLKDNRINLDVRAGGLWGGNSSLTLNYDRLFLDSFGWNINFKWDYETPGKEGPETDKEGYIYSTFAFMGGLSKHFQWNNAGISLSLNGGIGKGTIESDFFDVKDGEVSRYLSLEGNIDLKFHVTMFDHLMVYIITSIGGRKMFDENQTDFYKENKDNFNISLEDSESDNKMWFQLGLGVGYTF